MNKTIIYIACSLDGFIAGGNNDLFWLDEFNKPGQDYGYSRFLKTVGTVVMGRKTYETVLKFGAYPYKAQKSYILTSKKNLKPADKNVIIWTKGFKLLVKELGKTKKGIIWPVGGGELISAFINAGLVDEYIVFIAPLLLGSGTGLFRGIRDRAGLKLKTVKSYASGLSMLRYAKG